MTTTQLFRIVNNNLKIPRLGLGTGKVYNLILERVAESGNFQCKPFSFNDNGDILIFFVPTSRENSFSNRKGQLSTILKIKIFALLSSYVGMLEKERSRMPSIRATDYSTQPFFTVMKRLLDKQLQKRSTKASSSVTRSSLSENCGAFIMTRWRRPVAGHAKD